jgi:hypothetical protein
MTRSSTPRNGSTSSTSTGSPPARPASRRSRAPRARSRSTASGTTSRRAPTRTASGSTSQVEKAPNLTRRAQEPGANVGRCRVIELQPNPYGETLYNLHQDDNNRLNPDGTGWIVRGFFNLTDDKDSFFVLRDNRTDPSVEYRIALPAGAQLIVDTQRLWHAATHIGTEPRYCLITSWESGPELDAYIEKYNGKSRVPDVEVPQDVLDAGQAEQERRIAARAAYYAAKGQAEKTVMSEA